MNNQNEALSDLARIIAHTERHLERLDCLQYTVSAVSDRIENMAQDKKDEQEAWFIRVNAIELNHYSEMASDEIIEIHGYIKEMKKKYPDMLRS